MLPYITSQFMSRHISDPVLTAETSCRTGMHAAYALSGVDKLPLEVAPAFYDLRCIIAQRKKIQNMDSSITAKALLCGV